MNKIKEIIKSIINNKSVKSLLGKLINILNTVFVKVKNISIINNIFLTVKNIIVQHKIITSVIVVGVVIVPKFFHSNSEFPYECYGQEVRVETYFMDSTRHYSGPGALQKLVSEEDKPLNLAKQESLSMFIYDYKTLADLYQAKYESIEKMSGEKAAELFRRTVINDCN